MDEGTFFGVSDDFYFASGSENDVYAIAGDGNVWYWNGAWWWRATSGRIIEGRIFATSPEDIYGLSRDSRGDFEVVRWNGESWGVLASNGSIRGDFYFVSESEIYAIGLNDQVVLWDGRGWVNLTAGQGIIDHIQVVSPSQIYGIGSRREIVKWDGLEWRPITTVGNVTDYFVLKSETEIYAINTEKKVCLWDGDSWGELQDGPSILRRVYVKSPTEVFGLGLDQLIWQWNGEKWVKTTDLIGGDSDEAGSTYYRAKYIEGILETQPAIIAYKDRLIIAGEGLHGFIYIREWRPIRNESWDSARNSENIGLEKWYPLDGVTATSPELRIENGTLYLYVMGINDGVYRREYLDARRWSAWEPASNHTFSPGPFSSRGFTIVPTRDSYPSPVSLYRHKDYDVNLSEIDWIDDLIIYEISVPQFTSPQGPGTGTFASAGERMDYISELGVRAIWLTGLFWGDPQHFANIYTQYAVIDAALIEPTLGSDPLNVTRTERELKGLIEAAHSKGIKVFFDAVTHGVMSYSPLASSNPTFPPYVEPYPSQQGVIPHPDWFGAITFPPEGTNPDPYSFPRDTEMIDFVGGYEQGDLDDWWVDLWVNYVLTYDIDGIRVDLGSTRFDLWARIQDEASLRGRDVILIPEGEIDEYPFDLGVYDFVQNTPEWIIFANTYYNDTRVGYGATIRDMRVASDELFPRLNRKYYVVPVSCHDSLDYNFKGSRFEMGYGTFFTPFIPLFMSGEEFNNPNSPIPNATVPWLLGSEMRWEELEKPESRLYLDDVRKAISIRRSEAALSYYSPRASSPNVVVVDDYSSTAAAAPAPYMRSIPNGTEAILIVGNSDQHVNATFVLRVPLEEAGLGGHERYEVTDLWSGERYIASRGELESISLDVARDNFRILKITPFEGAQNWGWLLLYESIALFFVVMAVFLIRKRP